MAKFNHIDVRGTKKVPSAFGNVFISADSISAAKTVTFPDGYLNGATPEPNLAFKVVFANGHNAANASSYLSLNGVVVVSNQNGTLAPLPIHEMTEGGSTVYKVLQANTVLELYYTADYDGDSHPAFVVVGNPLVLSSSAYSIYADGQIGGMVTVESSTEISEINNKTLMDSDARLLAAYKSKVTVGKKTSGQIVLAGLYGTQLSFNLASDEFPLFVGQAAGSSGSLSGGVCYGGDKQNVFVSATNAGFNGYVELYYVKIS
ncbi:MAG: hypothetical protein II814_00285 [Treponema sp.]|nr:hypothetical protein [Treponema sp.]